MRKALLAVLSTLALPAVCFGAEMMRPGMWELSTTMEMPGMPMQMPTTKVKHCYSSEDVKDERKTIATNKDCTVTDMKQSGNKFTWKMKCTGENPGTFSGETVFKGDAYESTMKMQAEGQTMNMKVKGKRVGNCP